MTIQYKLLLTDNTTVSCDEYLTTNRGLYYSNGSIQVFIADVAVVEILN